jgi:hypothetical protein
MTVRGICDGCKFWKFGTNYRLSLLALGMTVFASPSAFAVGLCENLSGHYQLDTGDKNDMTYDTVIVQTACSEIKFTLTTYPDGVTPVSVSIDRLTDGVVRSDGPQSTERLTWAIDTLSWFIQNSDPSTDGLHDSSDSETITYQKLSPTQISRTLDLVSADLSTSHFVQTYTKVAQ